jgi:hypothetical protein
VFTQQRFRGLEDVVDVIVRAEGTAGRLPGGPLSARDLVKISSTFTLRPSIVLVPNSSE